MAVINNVVMESLAYSVSLHVATCTKGPSCRTLCFLSPVAKSEEKSYRRREARGLEEGLATSQSVHGLEFFFLPSTTASLSLLDASWCLHLSPGLGPCQHSDACLGERGVLTQRGLGGWWSSIITLPGHWVRSENSAWELDRNPPSVSFINWRAGILK